MILAFWLTSKRSANDDGLSLRPLEHLPAATIAPESPQNASTALPAPLPIPPELPGNWWQALHYGSREAMLSPRDASLAVQLVARELGVNCDGSGFTESVRVHTLRKMLDERFGSAAAWQAMNTLWRSAPPSPGAPQPSEDHSRLPPGPKPAASQPRWIVDLHVSLPRFGGHGNSK